MTAARRMRWGLWLLLAVAMGLVLLQGLSTAPRVEPLTYSEFRALLRSGTLSNVVVGPHTIEGTFSPDAVALLPQARRAVLRHPEAPHPFVTPRIEDPDLLKELEASGARYDGREESPWWSLAGAWLWPTALMLGLWWYLGRRSLKAGGAMAVGQTRARVFLGNSPKVTFADVAGIDEAREELMEIVDFLKRPDFYRRLGGKIPKGVLIVGPPGTGKTLLGRALAGEAKVPFFSLTGADFVELFVGVGAARVRDLFAQAKEHAPSIIFIDELDALGRARAGAASLASHEEREQTLNQLLAEMDGFDAQKGVIVIAATNRPEILDPALLRPGRFDRKVVVDRPDVRGREQILRVHTRELKLAPEVDLSVLAARTPGCVGADLANFANEAALRATRASRDAVTMADFEEAIERGAMGIARRSKVMSAREKEIVAHHEAGHAIVAEFRSQADHVEKISIIPRGGGALGYTWQRPEEDRNLLTKSELLARIDVLLGGRVAEEIVFREPSTGAEDDLQKASDLARLMLTRFGMSEALGLGVVEARGPVFLEGALSAAGRRDCSEETARMIDEGIRAALEQAHDRARRTLKEHEPMLRALAQLLVTQEVIDRPTLERVLSVHDTPLHEQLLAPH